MARGIRLLVVDGNVDVARALEAAFGATFDLTTTPSAEEALGHLTARHYGLVLADYALSGRDGAWLLREARRVAPWARRVLLSAKAVPGLLDLRAEGTVELFLPKPFDAERFRAYVFPSPACG